MKTKNLICFQWFYILIVKQESLEKSLEKDYYPLPTGKEAYNLADLTIKLDDVHYM